MDGINDGRYHSDHLHFDHRPNLNPNPSNHDITDEMWRVSVDDITLMKMELRTEREFKEFLVRQGLDITRKVTEYRDPTRLATVYVGYKVKDILPSSAYDLEGLVDRPNGAGMETGVGAGGRNPQRKFQSFRDAMEQLSKKGEADWLKHLFPVPDEEEDLTVDEPAVYPCPKCGEDVRLESAADHACEG